MQIEQVAVCRKISDRQARLYAVIVFVAVRKIAYAVDTHLNRETLRHTYVIVIEH